MIKINFNKIIELQKVYSYENKAEQWEENCKTMEKIIKCKIMWW